MRALIANPRYRGKSFRRKININVTIIKFKNIEYIFFYHNSDDDWISRNLINLKSKNDLFKFHIEIQLKEFRNKEFDETLVSEFLLFLEQNLDELDPTAQKILIPFNEIIDDEFLNHKEKFRFQFDTIYYKEPGRSFNTLYNKIGFNYSLGYQLYHADFEESYAPYTFYFVELRSKTDRVLKPSEFNEYLGSTKDFSGFKIEGLTPETMGTTKQELLEGALELIRKKL